MLLSFAYLHKFVMFFFSKSSHLMLIILYFDRFQRLDILDIMGIDIMICLFINPLFILLFYERFLSEHSQLLKVIRLSN